MKKIQSAKLNCLLAIQTLLLANPTIIAVLVALEEASEALAELISAINLNIKIQSSPSGAAEAKRDALTAVGDLAYEIAGAILSFAEKSGHVALAVQANISRSAMTRGSGNVISARIQGVLDLATEHVESLADHGVTQAKVTSLKQRLKAYDAVRVLPRQAVAVAAAATRQLEELFPEADRLVKNRIDKLVWQFRESEPELYQKYQVARSIVDAPSPNNDEETPAVVPVPTTPTIKVA